MDQLTEHCAVSPVPTHEVLLAIGFAPDAGVVSDPPGGLSRDFGRQKIEASSCVNLHWQSIVLLSGVIRTASRLREIHCELPFTMDSVDQGIAWVTWVLDDNDVFSATGEAPSWVERGRECLDLLPWSKREREYERRPHCLVRRDYARLGLKELAEAIEEAADEATIRLEFDGELLRVRIRGRAIVLPGRGEPWPEIYEIATDRLRSLPRRLSRDPVGFEIWEGALSIGNWRYEGVVSVFKGEGP